MITTLDQLGRSTQKMLDLAQELRERHVGLRVLNLGGGNADTKTPMGAVVFTVMAALAQMELEIKRERITNSVIKRRTAGGDLGGRRPTFTEPQRISSRPANRQPKSPRTWGCPRHPLPADQGASVTTR